MKVSLAESRAELGQIAARDVGAALRNRLREKPHLRIIFAAAPSQSEMLAALVREPGIDWQRVTAFHMDEYINLPQDAPQRFGNWLKREFFDHVPLEKVNLIQPGEILPPFLPPIERFFRREAKRLFRCLFVFEMTFQSEKVVGHPRRHG